MGPRRPLWVLLTLLRALQSQTPSPVPSRAAARVTPRLVSFQPGKFQGEWFILGLAGTSYRKENRRVLTLYTVTFELNDDNSYEVSYAMTPGQRCHAWSYTLMPSSQPGHFTVDLGTQSRSEEVQVFHSNYHSFAAVLSHRVSRGQEVLRVSLLGRSWALRPEAMDKFICLARAHQLSDGNIVFPEVIVWILAPDSCSRG